MTLRSSKSSPAAKKAERAAEGRRNTREKNELEGLDEPPNPIANAGAIGEEINNKIAEYRKKLAEKSALRSGSGRFSKLRTLKESILVTIDSFKASGKIKKLPANLEQLPTGEFHPYLPRFDWRDYNVTPSVRNQKDSSLCWAFTATQVYESGLMIQRANFAVNGTNNKIPNVFRTDMVELNARSTWQCMNPDDPDSAMAGGRYEAAFNFYTKTGISANSIMLIMGVPVMRVAGEHIQVEERLRAETSGVRRVLVSGKDLSLFAAIRDGELPINHCEDGAEKVKIIGWDYVKQKNQWNIPHRKELKKALLEHGPIAVSMNQNGLTEYGEQKIDAHCIEVGRNLETGVVFKQDQVSKDLFVRIPRKAIGTLRKEEVYNSTVEELSWDTFHNLNLRPEEVNSAEFWSPPTNDYPTTNDYPILGTVANCIQKGTHFRQAKKDRDVGVFFDKDTNEFIWHFPVGNEVQLVNSAGEWALRFPANTQTSIIRNQDGVLVGIPTLKEFEDLTPVFSPDPKARANHEVMLVGWDDRKRAWIVQNSWGEEWGFRCCAYYEDLLSQTRGFAYIAYEKFGQFAAWLEAPLIEQQLWEMAPAPPVGQLPIQKPLTVNIHAFIQAGGRSSRMVTDKAWLDIKGRPMIEHVLTAVRPIAASLSIVINSANPNADRYRELAAKWDARLLHDLHDHKGPLGGTHTALKACSEDESALILACDMPFLTSWFLRFLCEAHQSANPASNIQLPIFITVPQDQGGRLQPLAAIYEPACLPELEKLLAADRLKVDRLFEEVPTQTISFAEFAGRDGAAQLFQNINSPADYGAGD